MQLSEERLWQEFVRAYATDEDGEQIIAFTRRWADEVERLVEPSSADPHHQPSFRQALDSAFLKSIVIVPGDENQITVKANSDMVREAIFLLSQVWELGEEMVRNLTPIEQNALETIFNLKINAMQEQAAEEAEEKENP